MEKRILLGSIIAVVILVLVSFTGVVGYQTTKSSTIARASPLFSIRSKRAIDEESKDLTRDYVGKGEESVLSIPKREDRGEFQKFVKMFGEMDEIEIRRFLVSIARMINEKDMIRYENIYEAEKILSNLKRNPSGFFTMDYSCMTNCCFTFDNPILCLILEFFGGILTFFVANVLLVALAIWLLLREIGIVTPFTYFICS